MFIPLAARVLNRDHGPKTRAMPTVDTIADATASGFRACPEIVAIQPVACAPRLPRNTKVNANPARNPPICAM
jgi:hypothetical protein